jgi:hypothetical protein
VPSIVQCGSARHLPSSGATARRALLGVGRAPAIAFAPRTESREASSVLARCRRVCGRFSYSPGGCSGGWSSIRLFWRRAPWCLPPGRRADTIGGLSGSDRPSVSVTAGASASRHLAERPVRLCGEQCSSWVNGTGIHFLRTILTWGFSSRACDIDHKPPGRRAAFR